MADYDTDSKKPLIERMADRADPKKRDAFQKSFGQATGDKADSGKSGGVIAAVKRRLGLGG